MFVVQKQHRVSCQLIGPKHPCCTRLCHSFFFRCSQLQAALYLISIARLQADNLERNSLETRQRLRTLPQQHQSDEAGNARQTLRPADEGEAAH